jgi:molybdenum cofactor cytidylyltransferase
MPVSDRTTGGPAGQNRIGAVVLAAGQSRRMGRPKMLLPWRDNCTMIGHVVSTLLEAHIDPVVVVGGANFDQLQGALTGLPVRLAYNDRFAETEMLASLQIGLRQLDTDTNATLIVLGDQPTVEVAVVHAVVEAYHRSRAHLVVPSYQMRRGHPWLVARDLWQEIMTLPLDSSLRDFLNQRAGAIAYVVVESPGILKDMDTPEDYQKLLEEE